MNDLAARAWDFLMWIEHWDISTWVREGNVLSDQQALSAYYVMLAFHGIGMAIIVGVTFFLTARIFGVGAGVPLGAARSLLRLGWTGFFINLASGILLLIAQPLREIYTLMYDVKMVMVVAACVTMSMLGRALNGIQVAQGPTGKSVEIVPDGARVLALTTTVFWLMAVAAGRLIGYTEPPPM